MGRLTKVGGFGPLLFTLLLTPVHASTKHILEWDTQPQTQMAGKDINTQTDANGTPSAILYNGKCIQVDDVFTSVNTTVQVTSLRVSFFQQTKAFAGATNTSSAADWTVVPTLSTNLPTNIDGWWHGQYTLSPSDLLDSSVWPSTSTPDRVGVIVNLQLAGNVSASVFTRVIYELVPCN